MDDYGYRAPWSLGQKIACVVLFAAVMLALRFILHAVVPPAVDAADNAIGIGPVAAIMIAIWCVAAWFGYRPILSRWLAKRQG